MIRNTYPITFSASPYVYLFVRAEKMLSRKKSYILSKIPGGP